MEGLPVKKIIIFLVSTNWDIFVEVSSLVVKNQSELFTDVNVLLKGMFSNYYVAFLFWPLMSRPSMGPNHFGRVPMVLDGPN